MLGPTDIYSDPSFDTGCHFGGEIETPVAVRLVGRGADALEISGVLLALGRYKGTL